MADYQKPPKKTDKLILNPDTSAKEDLLGFDKYIDTLGGMIRDPGFETPFCIGIYGKWGSGKTSFMRLLSQDLQDHTEPHIIPVWFNPWRYSKEEHLIIPFLKTLEQTIKLYIDKGRIETGKKGDLGEKLKKAMIIMRDVAAAFAYCTEIDLKFLKWNFSKAIDFAEKLDKKEIEENRSLAEELTSLYFDITTKLKQTVDEKSYRFTVFIDDLDRCLPEKVIELMESIKLFLDIKGYLFVIGVDKEVVEKGIAHHYRFFRKSISADEYLEKIIQLPLELPPIETGRKKGYIESLLGKNTEYKKHADLIEIGVGGNPRALKRYINFLAFVCRHADTLKQRILKSEEDKDRRELIEKNLVPVLYIKWAIIVFKFPQVHSDIKLRWDILIELQEAANADLDSLPEEKRKEIEKLGLTEELKKVLRSGQMFPDDAWVIKTFIYLTEATRVVAAETEVREGYRQTFQPGDMVLVPKGSFLYGNDKKPREIDEDYYIDVFPVTNSQYEKFITEGGYKNKDFWTDEGWNWREKNKIIEPEYWKDEKFNQVDCPVVGVSWYEAEAFCNWRSKEDGKVYRLPTEEEWEKAARGTEGIIYPWGDEFNKEKCNTMESGIGKPTPINRYPQGASPYKCQDMAGNVWEWTDSWFSESKKHKVLRGGSWGYNHERARCADRNYYYPYYRFNSIGFRLARTKTG